MLFNSYEFIILVLVTFVLFYTPLLYSFQTYILIVASFIFYGSHAPILTLLLAFSVLVNAITSFNVQNTSERYKKRLIAIIGVAINLGLLGFFKYASLFTSTFISNDSPLFQTLLLIPLPIGISFFTFQGISLLVDVLGTSSGKTNYIIPENRIFRHITNICFYISFFPQLVAGPIVKAHEFLPQIKVKKLKNIDWELCFRSLVIGYFLKMVIADNLKDYTFWMEAPYFQSKSSAELVVMLFGYSMQIFSDFAGYSLIAIGVAALFGYRLPKNFNFPYISRSITEFWRRWHISLSSFLKEYLYIPLGGNRKGKYRTYINLMIVMLLGGLWHGAAWSYMVWGGFHGLMLAVERFFSRKLTLPDNVLVNMLKIFITFVLVSLAWLLFKISNFQDVIKYIQCIYTNTDVKVSVKNIFIILVYSFPVIIYHFRYFLKNQSYLEFYRSLEYRSAPIVLGVMLFMTITNSGSATAFVYFQF